MFKSSIKKFLFNINIFLLLLLINSANSKSKVTVKAGSEVSFSCDRNIFYILIDVKFVRRPPKQYYPFTLTLENPEDLKFKCMLDYPKSKIYCFHSFSNEEDFIEEDTLFRFPIPFPEIEGIKWDYDSFLNEVYRRVYNSKSDCGIQTLENLNDMKSVDYKAWDIESYLININNGRCENIIQDNLHRFYFDMFISFKDGDIIDKLNQNQDISLLQEIWVPLIPDEENSMNLEDDEFSFALCNPSEDITKTNTLQYKLECYVPIDADSVFDGKFTISSFFDKIYIKQGEEVSLVNIYIKSNDIPFYEGDNLIACPNKPIFTIFDKNAIIMGDYYNNSDNYYFYLIGTLNNGYFTFKNGTTVALISVYKNIIFDLIIQDNLVDSEDNDFQVQCVLPTGTPYDEEEEAVIKCTGKREENSNANNVDIMLNWQLKENNNFENIIIKWPKSPEGKKKNIYGYKLNGVSMRQSDYGCRDNNNFDFYVYIYDLGREPKLSFELPLASPKDTVANCKTFDRTALKCSLNLKHKRLSKGTSIMLPEKGQPNIIDTLEGNKITFIMHNFTNINNEHDFYVKTKEACGDYLVVGTLKDLGMSHKTSVVTYVLLIVFIFLFVFGSAAYIAYRCKLNYDRGNKLTVNEENKSKTSTTVPKI